jgi:hypothetical protein
MQKTMEAKLKIESWDEKPYRELDEGGKLTRADVLLSGPDDGLTSATSESLMFYRADGTSAYVTVMHITGMLGGRRGSFVLQGHGTYDGTTARGQSHVVEGSGTGELAGLTKPICWVPSHLSSPIRPRKQPRRRPGSPSQPLPRCRRCTTSSTARHSTSCTRYSD